MTVRIEKKARVWTVIHSRAEARFASGKGRHGDFRDI